MLNRNTEEPSPCVSADPAKALEWYERAAEKGDENAKKQVERLKKDGVSVPAAPVPVPEEKIPQPVPAPEKKEEKPKDKGGFFKKFFG